MAIAQNWPTKPVKLIAVFPPGGSVDQVARILAQQLAQQTGQQFIVENRGGASGSIGTAVLAKADPDGYTLGVVFDTHAVNPSLIPNLPFDTTRDLTPIMLVGKGGMALVTHPSQPYKSFRDVVAAAKAKPGSVASRHDRRRKPRSLGDDAARQSIGRRVQPHSVSRRRAADERRDRRIRFRLPSARYSW